MEPAPAKRRKLGHGPEGAEAALESAASTGISRSRAFVLEAEELLDSVRLDHATALDGADALLHRIKEAIEAIKPHEPRPIAEAAAKLEKKHKIKVPFPDPPPPENSNYKVAFEKPAQFNVVGSYVSKTMVRTQKDHAIDMVLVLPEGILQEKDYLDLRYFYKRAYYLAVVASALRKVFDSESTLSFERLNGNPLCPVLAFQPKASKDKDSENPEDKRVLDYRIRIIPCAPDGFFPKNKLHLGASLVRKSQAEHSDTPPHPTPFYNSTLVAESCFLPYLKVLRKAEKKCAAFKNACMLGRIWLQQRGFGGDIPQGGFGHFEWAVLLALLLQGGESKGHAALSASLSSTQLFKALIQFLSVTNFAEEPCVFGPGNGPGKSELASHLESGPILYDSAQQLNIAFKMGPWSAALLHQHAKWTRSLLADNAADQFNPTFILKSDFPSVSFDLFARLKFDRASVEAGADFRGPAWRLGSEVYRILKRALADKEMGERARLIHLQAPACPPWPLAEAPETQGTSPLEIGVLFDPANMARTVDRGPSAGPSAQEKEKCEEFRRFWGDKAELRRFERDTIRETLIWTSTTPFDLCEEIMRYVIRRHLRIGQFHDEITVYGNSLPDLLSLKPADTALFNVAKKAFGAFERDVRDLDDLPLRVRQIAPICPELRYSSVKPPTFGSEKSGPRPLECVISFEASGKWPESLVAIQRTKIAFLSMIGSLLESSKPGEVKTHIGLENSRFETENLAFLDVVYESGTSFRLRIQSDLEESLLERQVKDKTLEQYLRQRATTQLATFRRLFTNLPLHNQYISTCATRFPALSPTIRLVKHWFNAHKLSCHFTEEFIELAVLHVFLAPYPWDAPSSASTGFMRTLLFLARWDWRSEPLIVDTGGDMPAADRASVDTRLEAWRKIDPNMNHTVLFVATAQEPSGVAWTTLRGEPKPCKVAAARMTSLAKSASRLIREQGVELDCRRLFVPSLKDYDVLIRLNSKAVKSTLKTFATADPDEAESTTQSKFKNLDERTGLEPLPLAQHPADLFLEHLSAAYGGPLVFFRGAVDDHTIGAIWNPQMQRRSFRINLPTSYKPAAGKKRAEDGEEQDSDDEADVVEVNREAILAEIARIGAALVDKIEVKGG
ncbi:215f0399-e698-4099-963f-f3b6416b7bed [Thermothielavioides terrestris]|uniref:U3 small nucleolar RNA-associated protein 22 n=1 Tax=Thermothielavioides terrestris TaxID=2587410 RepID=A0A3S4AS90_9PEZI|nr:215f0399-e698-4099-963f-f3b6416b7bed [Thermothielavioides terrestris]